MKIQPFSDLHVDVSQPPPITIGADVDVVVVAGDTAEGDHNAFVALRRIVPERTPIVAVMGNHEYYRRCIPEELALARELAPSFNVHLLENDSVVLEIGGTSVSATPSPHTGAADRFGACVWSSKPYYASGKRWRRVTDARWPRAEPRRNR